MSQRRRVARNAPPRTVEIEVAEGPYAGWWARMRVDFPAGWLIDLQSGDFGRVLAVLGRIVVEHNFPDELGEPATALDQVDVEGLLAVTEAFGEARRNLPPR